MIRKKKKYARPRMIFESERIKEENVLKKNYGLKNKKEIWKTIAKVDYFRNRAKELSKKPLEEQEVLFRKLKALGLKAEGIADVLDLNVEDLLRRRLATVVSAKGLAGTPKGARQMVVHKKILVNGKLINSPSYLVPVAHEGSIKVKKKVRAKEKEVKAEEKVEEKVEETAPEVKAEEKTEEKK